jgi:predicted membrane chloride channel (bestrophin family)
MYIFVFQIIPFCLANVIWMILLSIIDLKSMEISNQGHRFITLVVSFLLVTRVNMALNRYNEARSCIGKMYSELRELSFQLCTYTSTLQTPSAMLNGDIRYRTVP